MKAFLLAAGLGTRLKPFTDYHPKALAKVNGKTLLEHNIKNLQGFGIWDIVVNVHHFADQIIDLLKKEKGFGSKVQISDETSELLETGGGLLKARPFLKNESDFLIMNVDILSNIDLTKMMEFHKNKNATITLAVQERKTSRYLLFNENAQLEGWKNVRTGIQIIPNQEIKEANLKPLAFSGIQMINQAVFSKINRTGKFSLIDLYLDLCPHNDILAYDHSGDFLLDVGKPESLIKAEELFQKNK